MNATGDAFVLSRGDLTAAAPRRLPAASTAPWKRPSANAGAFAVDHPWDPETVDDHAEPFRPERLFERVQHASVARERAKNALGFRGVLHLDRQRKALALVETLRRDVGAGQRKASHPHAAVHDLGAPVGGYRAGQRRALIAKERAQLAAKTTLIERESLF